jgi:transposase
MASIISKKVGGHTYYYLREMARVGGKPKMVSERYLGKASDIEAAMAGSQVLPERTRHLAFGALAGALSVLRRVGVAAIVDEVLGPRRDDAVASIGTYVELMVANRVVAPCSKLGFFRWWQETAGDRMVKVPASALDHRRFWEAMDALDAVSLEAIWHRVTERTICEFSLDNAGLVLDMTNVSTYVDSANERNTIAQRGHAKNKRHDLRLVGLSLIVTADGAVPIAHHAYPGNRPDVTQFQRALQALRTQLGDQDDQDLTVVFDAGMDSADNLNALDGLHFVGSVPPHQHPDLLGVADSEYRVVEGLSGVRAFERRRRVLGHDLRVVVTHSEEFHRKQSRGFDQTLAKATARLSDLARRLSGGKSRRGRRAVEDEIKEILSPRWVSRVLCVTLAGTSATDFALDFSIDADKREALEDEVFGKRVLITDRFEWTIEEVVAAYRSQWIVEGDFRQLKDPDCVAVAPVFHWTDQKITVHLFCCVLALSVLRLMVREVRRAGLEMSANDVLHELGKLQETVLLYPSTGGRPRARRMLTEMNDTQRRLVDLFGLETFAPAS